ncbi:hypothetical protein LS41612_08795 [Lysinibacillus sphaericus]|uniref:Uncharacterized protein n=1 Tax=Lysinibacillus sphaericus TaxID=1421 RepID=A0A2S0JZ33_LYSSH|nr:hypothetical protein LS41612_08795 [Lysinibacillus sphaericus]
MYGRVKEFTGQQDFIPFRYQGQYEDVEIGCIITDSDTTTQSKEIIRKLTQLGLRVGILLYTVTLLILTIFLIHLV